MHRKLEPQVDRRELRELTQRTLDAPRRPCLHLFSRVRDAVEQVIVVHAGEQPLAGIHGGTLAAQVVLRYLVALACRLERRAAHTADGIVLHLHAQVVRHFQLDEVEQRIRVASEHAGAARAVHRALAALRTLGMVVTVDGRAAEFGAHLVKLVAEVRHLIGGVLVAGDDLVNRVDNDRDVVLLDGSANQLGREPVHRHGLAAQIPDVDVAEVLRLPAEAAVHVPKTVQAGGAVKLEVDVQHSALCTVEAEPAFALGDGDGQLDERERLARLGRSGKQHLVSLPEHTADECRSQRRHLVPDRAHALRVGQVIGRALDELAPFGKVRLADVGVDEELLVSLSHHARHTRQARRIAVLLVEFQTVLAADRVQVFDPLAVLWVVGCINVNDGVHALAARVHQTRHRQLQFADERVLAVNIHAVALDERVAERGDVLVADALAVERVEADPRADRRVVVTEHAADVVAAGRERLHQLTCGSRPVALGRHGFAVLVRERAGDVADVLLAVEQRFEVGDELLRRMPLGGFGNLLRLDPVRVNHAVRLTAADLIVPAEFTVAAVRLPAAALRHLHDGSRRDGRVRAAKAVPLAGALAGAVAPAVPS